MEKYLARVDAKLVEVAEIHAVKHLLCIKLQFFTVLATWKNVGRIDCSLYEFLSYK